MNLLQMVVVYLKLKRMFQLAVCRVYLFAASVAAFMAG